MPVYETVGGRVTLHRRHAEALDRSDALAGFDSTTVNLYKLASSGLDLRPERTVLLGFAPLYSRFVDFGTPSTGWPRSWKRASTAR